MILRSQEPFPCPNYGEKPVSPPHALRVEVDLFSLPPALERMNQLLRAAPVDLRRLGEVVAEDPGLVVETLKLCNSSLFGLSQPVTSLEQAVIVVDAEIVRSLLLTCWLVRYSGAHVVTRENRLFWRHSLLVAQLSRRIGEWLDCAQPERAFLAGLLHDAGILPFLTMLSRNGSASQDGIFEEVGDSIELQRVRFGIDHCELGLKLGSILGFPTSMVEAAARHHQRGAALSGTTPVCFVSAAEMISQTRNTMGKNNEPSEPAGRVIRSTLTEYLPGLSRPVNCGLVEALESDLQSAVSPLAGIMGDVWDDSTSRPTAPREAGKRA